MSVFALRDSSPRAVFLGVGIHCSLGSNINQCLLRLRKPPSPPMLHSTTITGEVLSIPYNLLSDAPREDTEQRIYDVVVEVAEQAIAETGLNKNQSRRLGLFVGSSSFDISLSETHYRHELSSGKQAVPLRDPSFARLADVLLDRLHIRGPDFSINTACTASANALVAAVEQVEAGLLEYALVIGVELYNDITALGFHGLGLLTPSMMKPFEQSRDGLVLGESVSALVVGRDPGDGRGYFSLRGSASLCDTYSISATTPDGSTIRQVMAKALQNAKLEPQHIQAIKAHGTASLSNDEAESAGMYRLFDVLPPVCALKPYLGHTLGACGVSELVLFYRAIESGFLVAAQGISAEPGDLKVQLNQEYISLPPGNFMLNYFGFGGNNCSLIIGNGTERGQ